MQAVNISKEKYTRTLIVIAILIILPYLLSNQYYTHILVLSGIYVIMALGLNIVVGFAGLLDLGYIAFYAVGAYTCALFSTYFEVSFWLLLPLGGVLAAIFGILLGFPTLRVKGIYLATVTLGFGEIIRLVIRNWDSLTNGPKGIMGISHPHIFNFNLTSPVHFYYLILILGVATTFISYRLSKSPLGKFWIAIKDNEIAASVLGIDTVKMKLYAFAIGAFFAGVAGCFFASWQGFVAPISFTFLESIIVLCIVILGGMGSIVGSIISALILVILPELLRQFQLYRMLFFGLSLTFIMIYRSRRKIKAKEESFRLENDKIQKKEEISNIKEIFQTKNESAVKENIILEVEKISKNFGGLKALSNVNFKVRNLEILSIIGPNGAGKTTFFNCMSGIEKADQGRINFYEQRIIGNYGSLPAHKIAKLGISRTFQNTCLFESLSVLENVLIGTYIQQNKNQKENKKETLALELLNYVGLKEKSYERVNNLSYGHQRYLEIARALSVRPKLLLLDEPANGLNLHEKEILMNLLLDIREKLHVTIILIEHDMRVVMKISDHIVVLDHGERIAYGTPIEIQNNRLVQEAYLGRGKKVE
ncbi:MAG: ATP-binding cassette domain-containing protein [bacterium]|nr:ATP-binding cassette domain-containing protein [bacterium]